VFVNWKKDKRDVVQFGQDVNTTQKSAKKNPQELVRISWGFNYETSNEVAQERRGSGVSLKPLVIT